MARDIPDEWVQVKGNGTGISVEWKAIFRGLIGAPLAALGIAATGLADAIFNSVARFLDAIGDGIAWFVGQVLGFNVLFLEQASVTGQGAISSAGILALVIASLVGGAALYIASIGVDFLVGGDG